jgi:hypothetical protein
MTDNEFAPAGWMAIAGAILTLPLMGMGFILDIVVHKAPSIHPVFPMLYIGLGITQAAFVLFAFYRFKVYLNERHSFHATDVLIMVIIGGAIAITTIGLAGKVLNWILGPAPTPVLLGIIAVMVVIGVPLGILSVIFGIKLLEMQDNLNGLLKPYAILNIVAGVCFATFILAPLGLLIGAAGDVVMGLILLRKGPSQVPEFV